MVELFAKKPSGFQLPLHTVVIDAGPGKVGWLQLESKKTPARRSCWFNLESNAKRWFSKQKGLDPRCRIQTYHKVDEVVTAGRSLKSIGCTEIALYDDDTASHMIIAIDDFIGTAEMVKAKVKEAGLEKRFDPAKVAQVLKDAGLEHAPEEEQLEALEKFGFSKLSLDQDSNLPIKVMNLNCLREGCAERWAELSMYHIKKIDLVLESLCEVPRSEPAQVQDHISGVPGALEPLKASTGPKDPEQREYGCVNCKELLMRIRITRGASAGTGAKLSMVCAQCGTGADYEMGTGGAKEMN